MESNALLVSVMRTLGAAWRTLRLYPSDSPMTIEATERACAAIEEYVQAEPSLKLDVMRGGFILRGVEDVLTAPGAADLADALGTHGIGELHFVAPPDADEMIALLTSAQMQPQALLDTGGMQRALADAGVASIRVVNVVLQKIETPPEIPEEEADKFLAELAADAGRLSAWLRSLLASDDEGLSEGIMVLANAAGDVKAFGRTMAAAFLELETDDTDRLLEASITLEPIREVCVEMLANLSGVELTAAVRGGRYGENVMALSYALTNLPVGVRSEELLRETIQALASADTDPAQIELLERMIALRAAPDAEAPLAAAYPEYRTMLDAARESTGHLEEVRAAVNARPRLDAGSVTTVFYLLDIASNISAYAAVLGALSHAAPHLLELGDPELGMYVVREISRRSVATDKPWPELESYFNAARDETCGQRSMAALLAMADHPEAIENAKELVALGGDPAAHALGIAAMESEADDSMEFAEAVLGRRLPELLAPETARAEARHAARLAELFARDASARCMQALGELVARPEDQVRAKTARGIGAGGGLAITTYLPKLLRDESQTVALVAARTLAQQGGAQGIEIIAGRLGELDGESDLPLAREVIASLAVSPAPSAVAALEEAAGRGRFLRKGRYAEIKRLASEALDLRRTQEGS